VSNCTPTCTSESVSAHSSTCSSGTCWYLGTIPNGCGNTCLKWKSLSGCSGNAGVYSSNQSGMKCTAGEINGSGTVTKWFCCSAACNRPSSCSISCGQGTAFGLNSPNLGKGGSSDPYVQISAKVSECANSCGYPNTTTCNNVTWVKCCK